jgi:hypothetical protein
VEDEELEAHQMTEGMPTTIAGFKDHPLYAHYFIATLNDILPR